MPQCPQYAWTPPARIFKRLKPHVFAKDAYIAAHNASGGDDDAPPHPDAGGTLATWMRGAAVAVVALLVYRGCCRRRGRPAWPRLGL